tara:strand:- start:4540 stop:5616 length:1077 start_codon:yes stop_codon:yes gene_type:complete
MQGKLSTCLIGFFLSLQAWTQTIPIKDLVDIAGIRDNQLIGYGLVVGLPGTGEKTEYTQQTFKTMLKNFGINLPASLKPKLKNIAVVAVHATMPAFIKAGQKIDVTVSSIGEAKSIRGGTLLQTFMKGVDGQVYAIAQGSVLVGGLSADAVDGGRTIQEGATVGRILNGAIVERQVLSPFETSDHIIFNLRYPDFSTAKRLASAINTLLGRGMAHATDATSVKISAPRDTSERVRFISRIENIRIEPKMETSKIIINSHTGTIVVGSEVQLLPVAITHGSLTLTIKPPENEEEPVLIDDEEGNDEEEEFERMFVFDPGTTLNELVKAINDVGAAPSDVLAILEALKQAGALYGDLVIL